ncbi:sugar-binding protein [Frigoriglobus tundricola]|uniref:sugar-binding protein n=1 Tax=Frigoriglobus tundricola TaxID=2774151 RepID=UPI001D0600CE|nr:sugar-binding protein [Frigoriglobus tundricola]
MCDTFSTEAPAAEVLALHVAKEAFKQAADPNAFPEQLSTLNLKPWAAKKLYALALDPKAAPVKLDQSVFNTKLNDTPRDYAEQATRVLAGDAAVTDRRCFVLVAHRLQGAESHAHLMDGIAPLAPGGKARRAAATTYLDPAAAAEKQKTVQARRNIEALAGINDPEFGGAEKLMGALRSELKKMPDDVAARTAYSVGSRLAREGKWTEAREVFGMVAIHYPGHPLAVESFRWLARYHSSSEIRRRTEVQSKLMIKSVSFDSEGGGKIKAASGTTRSIGNANVAEDRYTLFSPEMILKWHGACLELEPKLAGFGPVYSRDPASWLCFLTARRQVGRFPEADAFVSDYFKQTPGAVAMAPGVDPWRDCLAAELWLANRSAMPVMPKALGVCRITESRPLLDGKLDDTCWRDAKPLELRATGSADTTDEARAFGTQYKTESLFTYDEQYLYIAVKCAHPPGKKVEPVAKRTRDADLTGHDRVDVLLDMDRDYQTYYRFQIDHRGALAEDCWGDKGWNPKYHVAFHAGDDGWAAEIAIPLYELTGERPSHGKAWAVNVSRVVPGRGIQAWSGPADNDPRPEGMGVLQFRSDSK